jgi:hypothetical protein
MLESTTKFLSVSQRKKPSSVKEIATIAHDYIIKTRPNSRSQIIDALTGFGFSEIQANEGLRSLEDNEEIFLEDSSCFLKVVLHQDVSQYSQERSKLQQSWIEAREHGGEW